MEVYTIFDNHIVKMHYGRIIATSSRSQLRRNGPLCARLAKLQFSAAVGMEEALSETLVD